GRRNWPDGPGWCPRSPGGSQPTNRGSLPRLGSTLTTPRQQCLVRLPKREPSCPCFPPLEFVARNRRTPRIFPSPEPVDDQPSTTERPAHSYLAHHQCRQA